MQRPFHIIPSVIRSDDSLKMLKPTERMCYFEGEKKFQFFKIYTKHNCDIEFLPNLPRQLYSDVCDCIPFNFPRESITRVCGFDNNGLDDDCVFHFMDDFKKSTPLEKFRQYGYDCLPPCEIRESRLKGNEWVEFYCERWRDTLKLKSSRFDNITHLSFKFGVEDFYPLRRTLRFTIIDFLSNVGGVLGLFAGISVLSIFEIVYFFTLRLVSNFFISRKASKHQIIIVNPAK